MSESIHRGPLRFGGPAVYRLVIQGRIDPSLSDCLGGFRIDSTGEKDQQPVTILIGEIKDQAELSGVLSTIYDQHLPILKVEKLNGDDAEASVREGKQ